MCYILKKGMILTSQVITWYYIKVILDYSPFFKNKEEVAVFREDKMLNFLTFQNTLDPQNMII